MRHALPLLVAGTLSAGALVSWLPSVSAAPSVRPGADVGARLRSGDPTALVAVLDEVRATGKDARAAAPAVVELLERGSVPSVQLAALSALEELEHEPAGPVLASYARHRDVKIRRSAVRALGRTRSPSSEASLRRSLGDPDADVRASAALGLGQVGSDRALPDLGLALDHGVAEAAVSLGRLCRGDACAALGDLLGKQPFDVATSAIEPALFRPATEVPDPVKIALVERVRGLKTQGAARWLSDVEARAKDVKGVTPKVRAALKEAATALQGATR